VRLRFILTQHVRDEYYIQNLVSTLNWERYIPKSGYGVFTVERFSDVYGKVIYIFEQFKLQGVESDNFKDLKKLALMIKNKHHLTR